MFNIFKKKPCDCGHILYEPQAPVQKPKTKLIEEKHREVTLSVVMSYTNTVYDNYRNQMYNTQGSVVAKYRYEIGEKRPYTELPEIQQFLEQYRNAGPDNPVDIIDKGEIIYARSGTSGSSMLTQDGQNLHAGEKLIIRQVTVNRGEIRNFTIEDKIVTILKVVPVEETNGKNESN